MRLTAWAAFKELYHYLFERKTYQMRAFVRDVRTFMSGQAPEVTEMISGIKTLLGESAELKELM